MAGHAGPSHAHAGFGREDLERSISHRFEEIVRRDPTRPALEVSRRAFTYQELNRAANRVAHAILEREGHRASPVAILTEDGAFTVGAILGVLKASGTFVVMDPAFPHARLRAMLEDSQAGLLVTDGPSAALGRELAAGARAVLNAEELDPGLSTDDPALHVPPDAFAYIVYTSGSTGEPKGIIHNHRNLLHTIMNYTQSFAITAEDRLTLLHSCSFSSGLMDTFCAILNGASLHPFDLRKEGTAHLPAWLEAQRITIYSHLPSAFRQLASALTGRERFPCLRLIAVGSEPVTARDVDLYRRHFSPPCRFVNRLGTTETNNFRLYFVDRETPIEAGLVPAGYAVPDKDVLLLDEAGEAVEIGGIAEIAVRSRYLSPGYWQRPTLTREAFLPDPSGGGERIYRTGDLGVMRPDGCLVHLGRKDFQVKVRGHRIEVAEIEKVLLELHTIKEAAVVGRPDRRGDQRLVAYVVPAGAVAPTLGDLRRTLEARLPDFMVPSTFVMLEGLPRTPNGKIDRRALPAPPTNRPDLGYPYAPPMTPVEERLAGIWAEVLDMDRVGVHDHFLDLGGHSLLATQVLSQVLRVFARDLPLRSLFEARTVAAMAAVIAERQVGSDDGAADRLLAEVERLSEQEAERLLADEAARAGHPGRAS